ncbi:SPOR domain-containing protein [Hyphomicrobium sp.]|uniref:SPOR domain-containing protein n=1 Tax=Hyphomicrobium sp. TaxID=82 RepID=UPI0025C05970|nr:SPOR domain-containing protein [Hyphomicrobium sp.]MCC7250379.1 SPOR domain-containing protein [Hyphomicrobium sp.]
MINATHGGSGGQRTGARPLGRGWRKVPRLAAAVLAVGLVGLPCTEALAQAKKKGEEDAPAQKDTAGIQRAYAAGARAFESGDMVGAEQQLSVALSGGGLPNAQMARALYLRGAAARRLGKPAQAISDLTTAVWLKGGLSEADKTKATEERQLAYREAGLGDTPPPIGAAPLDQSSKTAAGTPAPTTGAQVVHVTNPGFWGNFSMPSLPTLPSLTGGSSQPEQSTQAPAQADQPQQTQQSSFWSFLPSLTGSSQPEQAAAAPAAVPATGFAGDPGFAAASQGQGSVTLAESAPAAAPAMAWDTQTASAPVAVSEAPVAQPLASSYAPPSAPDTGINPMGAPADSSAPAAAGNPLAGTGTAVSNFFGNIFGSGTSAAPTTDLSAAVTTGSTPQPGTWGSDTTVVTAQTSSMVQRGPDSPPASSPPDELPWGSAGGAAPQQPIKVAASGVAGKYKLQVAAVRSREEAERLAQTLHGYPPVRDGMVTPEIDEAVIGSMGTFYRVRLGPYTNAKEPNQLCTTLKPQGFDCLVVTQ